MRQKSAATGSIIVFNIRRLQAPPRRFRRSEIPDATKCRTERHERHGRWDWNAMDAEAKTCEPMR